MYKNEKKRSNLILEKKDTNLVISEILAIIEINRSTVHAKGFERLRLAVTFLNAKYKTKYKVIKCTKERFCQKCKMVRFRIQYSSFTF